MKKHIAFYYGFNSPYEQRVKRIKDCGFDGVMVYFEFSDTFYEECDCISRSGLEIESIHMPFRFIANKLWIPGKTGESFLRTMKKGVDFASSSNVKNLTVHISESMLPPPVSETGILRLKQLIEYADRKNVSICIENLRRPDYFEYVFTCIPDTRLKICFDSGHANAFWKKCDLSKYYSQIVCCHLHDNFGRFDSHNIPFEGTINWQKLCTELKKCSISGLTIESGANKRSKTNYPSDEEDYLRKCYESLCIIDKMIANNQGS